MPTNPPLNILLILTDQLRPDAVGFGPDGRFATPNIDRIAAGSVFAACQTVNPLCQPARTALLTGKYTHQIGLRAMSGDLSPQHPTFPRALRDAGYHTAAVGKLHYLQTWPWGTGPGEGNDLTATILDAAGLDAAQVLSKPWPAGHDRVPCRSLLLMVRGESEAIRDCSFSEGTDWECLQTTSHKYVRLISGSPGQRNELLFDLVNDPTESVNVAGAPNNQALIEWFRIRREEILDATPSAQLTHVPWPA